jgi:hypothetical protein
LVSANPGKVQAKAGTTGDSLSLPGMAVIAGLSRGKREIPGRLPMSVPMVLLPVFVLVGLTFVFLFWTGSGRRGSPAGRAAATEAGEAFYDPLQLAMLFYVLIAIALPLRHADLIIVALSWVFVVTRVFHAGVFATSSDGKSRSLAYYSGALVLFAMWLYFALRILFLI